VRVAPIGKIVAVAIAAALLQACQPLTRPEPIGTPPPVGTGWRSVASAEDQARLDQLANAWTQALAAARGAGFARQIAGEGTLLQAEALPRAAPSPGPYRCRIIRLGAPRPGRAYAKFAPYFCYVTVEGEQLGLTKQTGSERPAGFLWDDGSDRMIFVGAAALGNEARPPAYGDNAGRNLVGILERVGTYRYRVAMPRPAAVAVLDVLEMVPVVGD
jgi:hypothetical protein